jgi:radical SAM superfamily enzyme YgiQ (UPF0313 family)
MNVLLLNPPQELSYPQPPIGLACLASMLEKEDIGAKILDANALGIRESDVATHLQGVDVVGITAITPTVNSAIRIARAIREKDSDMKIMIGGPHATLFPEETLRNVPEIDFLVKGEGEVTIGELLKIIGSDGRLEEVKGIAYRKNGDVKITPDRPFVANLDDLPFPAYRLLPIKDYMPYPPHGIGMPFMAMLMSRGCPFHCTYCSKPIWGNTVRAQSPGRTTEEMVHLKDSLGVKEILFYDDTFTMNRKRTLALCESILDREVDIPWSCETRVDLVDAELLAEMNKAGCYLISFGVESGNQTILDSLKKGIKLEDARKAFRLAREAGIQTVGYFMIGSPGDTPDTIRETIEFAKSVEADFAQFSITTPFPGTELYEVYKKGRGAVDDWDKFIYAKVKNVDSPAFETELLSREDLKWWSKEAYKRFYFRPNYLFKRMKTLTNSSDIRVNLKGFEMFMNIIRG